MADDTAAQRVQFEFERARAQAEANAAARRQKEGTKKPEPLTLGGAAASLATGVRNMAEGSIGQIGDMPQIMTRGVGKLTGQTPDVIDRAGQLARENANPMAMVINALKRYGIIGGDTAGTATSIAAPTTEDVRSVTDPAVSAISPQAQEFTRHPAGNTLERGLQTLGEFSGAALSPGNALQRSMRVVAPTIGSEVGGAVGGRLGREDLGRLIGGLGGALLPTGVSMAVAGRGINPERQRLVQELIDSGVNPTAGQIKGKGALPYLEAGPFEGKPAGIAERQGEEFNRAGLNASGINADRITPDVIRNARADFGTEYDDMIRQVGGLPLDGQVDTDLLTLMDRYQRLAGDDWAVRGYFDRISDAAHANNNVVPAEIYQQVRSEISADLRSLNGGNPLLEQTLRDFQDALHGSIDRNIGPQVGDAWRDLNTRYRNFKQIEKSMLGPGKDTAEGLMSPAKLRTVVAGSDKSGYLTERGDLDTLARAGEAILKPLPNSGTAGRAFLPAVAGAAATGALSNPSNPVKGALIGGGTVAISPLASSLLTSRQVQRPIIDRLIGRAPAAIDPVTAALLARQAGQQDQGRR